MAAAPRSSHPSSSSSAGPLLPADKKVDVEFAVRFDMLLCFDIYRPGQVLWIEHERTLDDRPCSGEIPRTRS